MIRWSLSPCSKPQGRRTGIDGTRNLALEREQRWHGLIEGITCCECRDQ